MKDDRTDLVHCLCVSAACARPSFDQLLELLEGARRRNAAWGVTGVLVHDHGLFLHYVEGPGRAVEALTARVALDARHAGLRWLSRGVQARRRFPGWSLGFVQVDGESLSWLGRSARLSPLLDAALPARQALDAASHLLERIESRPGRAGAEPHMPA
ncbi:MAG: hypothetical protein RLZZ592_719 [Pseudomonadota bacterium]|jgi:hypothetical protein